MQENDKEISKSEYAKKYYELHKERLNRYNNERAKQMMDCKVCNISIRKVQYKVHARSDKHILNQIRQLLQQD